MKDLLRTFSMYNAVGGAPTVERLVQSFYARMDALPEARTIRAMHAEDLAPMKEILRNYLTEWLGGPALYTPVRGEPRLRRRHLGFAIGEAERDAWMACMRPAIEETIADAEIRAKMLATIGGLADWMRNVPGNPHDERDGGAHHHGEPPAAEHQ